ncbi:MAG: ScyD/ScyE family protein [Microbacteriaceae bacterium]|nr:ScyD/ScyE family protein [Microbacteriaceae bacterium]
MKKPLIPLVTCGALVAATMLGAAPAMAAPPVPTAGDPQQLADGFTTPLSLEVDRQRVSYISQNFVGLLTRVDRDGSKTDVVSSPGMEIGAVSSRDGVVYYAENAADLSSTHIKALPEGGTPTVLADIRSYEEQYNPDQDNSYGFEGITPECAAQFPTEAPPDGPPGTPPPPYYTGLIDSHPYASLALNNAIFVADAGMNAILRVGYDGSVSTVAVLPPQAPIHVTAEIAEQQGLPACTAGTNYIAEPVPTDVEIGPDGWLYVTTLPGGPEDPSLGGRGSVYKVNPKSGEVVKVAGGFGGATGLAVSTSGTIYVAELFGGDGSGQISVLPVGASAPTPLLAVPGPAAIEIRANRLFVTWNALSDPPAGTFSLIEVELGGA